MKKILLFIPIITILFFVSLVFPNISKAVYFATDNVYLYENEKRIHDNSAIFLVSYKSHSERCKDGLCLIGQQFYPVTIYRAKNNDTLTFPEFSSQHPYQGDKYDGPAKDRWNAQNTENYLKYLGENSYYSVSFNPGPSEGGVSAPPGVIGGRIGDDRYYVLEIDNGNYRQISGEPAETFEKNRDVAPFTKKSFWKNILSTNNIIYSSIFIIVLASIIYFIKNRKKYKYKDQK